MPAMKWILAFSGLADGRHPIFPCYCWLLSNCVTRLGCLGKEAALAEQKLKGRGFPGHPCTDWFEGWSQHCLGTSLAPQNMGQGPQFCNWGNGAQSGVHEAQAVVTIQLLLAYLPCCVCRRSLSDLSGPQHLTSLYVTRRWGSTKSVSQGEWHTQNALQLTPQTSSSIMASADGFAQSQHCLCSAALTGQWQCPSDFLLLYYRGNGTGPHTLHGTYGRLNMASQICSPRRIKILLGKGSTQETLKIL